MLKPIPQFENEQIEFTYSNDEWAETHLPMVRIAVHFCNMDAEATCKAAASILEKEGEATLSLLDSLSSTAGHLEALARVVRAAEARLSLSLSHALHEADA